jgi:hypothetical protein
MPSHINPVDAAFVFPVEKKDVQKSEKKQIMQQQEKPDVTKWVRKANARLSPPWAENEMRCGRAFEMKGATIDEANELAELFKTFSTIVSYDARGNIVITFRPAREKKQQMMR